MGLKEVVAEELEGVRLRSLALTDLSDDDLCRQHSSLMSPLVWDLAHVGNYEDQWLLRAVDAGVGCRPDLDDLYDAFRHPRTTRSGLSILPPDAARSYIGAVRDNVLDVLDRAVLDDGRPLLHDAFVYGMVVQHEHQHAETMLATRQLAGLPAVPFELSVDSAIPHTVSTDSRELRLPGGEFMMGTDIEPWAYDNERPAHPVTLEPFWIDTALVTNADYLRFIGDGGYDDRRWWSDAGWNWRREAALSAPQFWSPDGSGWAVERFGRCLPLAADEPVQHVCWYEAEAYAAWSGRRLPTEAEWEFAAAGASALNANVGQRADGPRPAGTHAGGLSAWGITQMIGDVWEWTSSDFTAYPGFTSFPYREYSEVFFGPEYRVLRGGSWATHPTAIRTTFRNWDYPIRRQIFAGFRTARDA